MALENYRRRIHDPLPRYIRDRLEWERGYLKTALDHNGGNISAAARSIGMTREHLHGKLHQVGLGARRAR